MTQPKAPRPPRRCNSDYRWTQAKMLAFLRALSLCGSVARAARAVGMSRQSAYRLRARMGAGLLALWDDGVALGRVRRMMQATLHASPADGAQGDTAR